MKLYYGGAEVPSWRKFLNENGIHDVYMSYMGLRRRIKFERPWIIAEKFPEHQSIMLDSGCYTVNQPPIATYAGGEAKPQWSIDEIEAMAEHYRSFVEQNIDRLDSFTEFDALPLGRRWIANSRDLYSDFGDKFMPVWHGEYGPEELERMASRFGRIGILQTELGERSLIPMLNGLVARYGVKLHGLAMTKPEIMKDVKWDSVGSTSWISPSTYGDTHVWTGRELKRYPKAYKEEARKRHRSLFINAGFDADKIAEDDRNEVLKLAVWSWEQLMVDINRKSAFRSPASVTNLADTTFDDHAESDFTGVDSPDETPQNAQLLSVQPTKRSKQLIPGAAFHAEEEDEAVFRMSGDSLRQCNSCPLSTKNCPGYEENAECLYAFPIELKTERDLIAMENGLLEMQAHRVMFMKMNEDLDGFSADPAVLSKEMDRLNRMIKDKREGNMEKTTLVMKHQKPGAGFLAQVGFDAGAVDMMSALPQSIDSAEILEAQVTEQDDDQ